MKSQTLYFIFILILANLGIGLINLYYTPEGINGNVRAISQIDNLTGGVTSTESNNIGQISRDEMNTFKTEGLMQKSSIEGSNSVIERMWNIPRMLGACVKLLFGSMINGGIANYGIEVWELIVIGIANTLLFLLDIIAVLAMFRELILRLYS